MSNTGSGCGEDVRVYRLTVYKGVSRYPLVNPFTRGLTLVPLVNKVLDSQADPRMPDWVSSGLL